MRDKVIYYYVWLMMYLCGSLVPATNKFSYEISYLGCIAFWCYMFS